MGCLLGCPLGRNTVRTKQQVERFLVDVVHKTGNRWRQIARNVEHPFSINVIEGV